jgi:hypothetical protein
LEQFVDAGDDLFEQGFFLVADLTGADILGGLQLDAVIAKIEMALALVLQPLVGQR